MSSSYLVECHDCDFEKVMIGDDFAQWTADKHQDRTNHAVSIRNTTTDKVVYSSSE
ncbi:hypothetical protein [Haloferax elongans]|uniref:hypothetical protein n=1 Tax=Haloferax elongans TaxID=403191 RepID=UPI000AAC2F99|nr:hypothetical protein [Haloferax elongans]